MDANDTAAAQPVNRSSRRSEQGPRRIVGLAAVAGLALAAGLLAWFLTARSDDAPSRPTAAPALASAPTAQPAALPEPTVGRPVIRTVTQLRAAAASSAVPVFWVGPKSGMRLELSEAPGSTSFVRYLPGGTQAGDGRPHLTVATYARPNGFAEIQAASKDAGAKAIALPGGGLAVYDPGVPTNVHLAYPGDGYQVEVFSPEAGVALRLVEKHVIRRVR